MLLICPNQHRISGEKNRRIVRFRPAAQEEGAAQGQRDGEEFETRLDWIVASSLGFRRCGFQTWYSLRQATDW